ncbi:g6541 [Coccomyxa elongata]
MVNTLGNGTPQSGLTSELNECTLFFVYLAIVSFLVCYLEIAMWMLTGARQATRLRQKYLQAVLRQDATFFDVHARSGDLLQGLNEDTSAIQLAIGEKMGNFIDKMVTFGVGMGIAFYKGWDMTLVILAATPVLAGVGIAIGIVMANLGKKASDAYAKASSIVAENLGNVRTVLAFNGADRAVKAYEGALEVPMKMGVQQGIMQGITVGFTNCTFLCSYALAFWYGSTRVRAGKYDGGDVMSVLFAALLGGFALGQAAPNIQFFVAAKVAGARVLGMINRKPEIDDQEEGEKPESVQGHIELKGVHFNYPARPELQIFRDFSLDVPAGTTVALVGESGSGKSTVIQLVERFYDPDLGAVFLDGHDIRQLQLTWYRQQMGIVSQEPTLFATTIRANIAYGKPDATDAEIEAAAASANAHNFIAALPNGYDTHIGEKGVQMSGGQKQRVAIARALLRNPRILLLDEATSALDNASERIVQDALQRLMIGRTTIVVAHRLSTIVDADSIAVVKGGRIVEQGTHKQLMAHPDGAYAALAKMQMGAPQSNPLAEKGAKIGTEEEKPTGTLDTALSAQHSLEKQVSASAPLLQGVKRAVRVSIVAMGAAPLAPKEQPVAKDPARPEEPKVQAGFGRLWQYNKQEWPFGLMGCVGSFGLGFMMPGMAYCMSSIIAVLYNPDPAHIQSEVQIALPALILDPSPGLSEVSKWCGVFAGIGGGAVVMGVLQQYGFACMGQHLTRRLRALLFSSMLRQEVGWFDREENASGALASRLSADTAAIRGALGDQVGLLVQNLVTFAVAYLIAFSSGWKMTLVVTASIPVMVIAGGIQASVMTGFSSKASELFDAANQTASEAFAAMRTVAAFQLAEPLGRVYEGLLAKPQAAVTARAHASGLGFGFSQFAVFSVYALAFWYGGQLMRAGQMDFAQVLKVLFAILLAALGIAQGQMSFPDITQAAAAIDRVFGTIDRAPTIDVSDSAGKKLSYVVGEVELRKVCFRYPARPQVSIFENFSIRVSAGTILALVGQSGSGKSSVISLIQRFYDPLSGQVLIDGTDVRELNLGWLRQMMALVSQEPALFTGTIRDNIAYGCPDATDEQVAEAANAANALAFITKAPAGFRTLLGEGGVQLSGGQKQRIAIARALIKNPRILLLDEATSALDAESEGLVQEALARSMAGRTTIVVAHRLSTIRSATTIAVVQTGRILEQGSHEELMRAPDGAYALLVRARQQEPPPPPADTGDGLEGPAAMKAPMVPRKTMAARKSVAAARKSTAVRKSMAPGGRAARASVYAGADPEAGAAAGMAGGARRAARISGEGVQIAGQAFGRMRASVFGGY